MFLLSLGERNAVRRGISHSAIHSCSPPHRSAARQASSTLHLAEEGALLLHVVRYAADRLDEVIDTINATGYGLTLSIHSRVD